MPPSAVEVLQERAVTALKSKGKPWHGAATQAHELLMCMNRFAKNKDPHPETRAKLLAEMLDRSHPLTGQRWFSWATAVSTHEKGSPNRGHVLRALAELRDTR